MDGCSIAFIIFVSSGGGEVVYMCLNNRCGRCGITFIIYVSAGGGDVVNVGLTDQFR